MLRKLHLIYSIFTFTWLYLAAFPFFFLFAQRKSWHHYAYRLNFFWSHTFFFLIALRTELIYEEKLQKNQRYVFCPNHASALDIVAMCLIREPFTFVGKSDIARVPLFGYMFRKLHIPVDRRNMKSKYQTIVSSKQAIADGKNVLLFPEGGIIEANATLSRFKDGPFRIAIETGTPVVPVTIPFNWIFLPDENIFRFKRHRYPIRIILHKPIETTGMTLDNLDELKQKTFDCIQKELGSQLDEH